MDGVGDDDLAKSVSRAVRRAARGLAEICWERIPDEAAVGLTWLFVDRSRRGWRPGLGTAVLSAALAEFDRRGLACELEADGSDHPEDPSTHILVRWYRRFGFAETGLNDQGWVRMRREPRPWRGGPEAVRADHDAAKAAGGGPGLHEFRAWLGERLAEQRAADPLFAPRTDPPTSPAQRGPSPTWRTRGPPQQQRSRAPQHWTHSTRRVRP